MTTDPLAQVRSFRARSEQARQRAIATARVTSTVFGALLALGAVAAVVVGAMGRAPLPAAGVGALMGGGFAVMLLRMAAAMRRPSELAQTGIAATAVFEEVVGGGVSLQVANASMQGTVSQTRVRMQVEVEGRGPYAVEVTDFLPMEAYGRLVRGTRFAAYVDRARPQRVLIDWEAGG
jgi:hypothetical protein